ncbi:hypothetical protein ACQP1P_38550 [Dactylosporangium sp. CA-052675]|uniref:hypothetical protein n=1 Tax=Dactylosporangium sp. CA-052675 TaxID=3239927 RepID=UPI003D946951
MTDGLDQALVNAGLALLAADPISPAMPVYDGTVPAAATRPYWVIYTSVSYPAESLDNSVDGRSRVREVRWIVHSVGDTAASARAGAQRARSQLLDASPTIPGLSCGRIRMEESQPPVRDDVTGVPVMSAVQTYRLRASSS